MSVKRSVLFSYKISPSAYFLLCLPCLHFILFPAILPEALVALAQRCQTCLLAFPPAGLWQLGARLPCLLLSSLVYHSRTHTHSLRPDW